MTFVNIDYVTKYLLGCYKSILVLIFNENKKQSWNKVGKQQTEWEVKPMPPWVVCAVTTLVNLFSYIMLR